MTIMLQEIKEQPKVLRNIAKTQIATIKEIAKVAKEKEIKFIMTAARGTSNHGAVYGNYLFEVGNGIPCGIAELSAITHYDAKINFNNTMVIAVSQSGAGPDVCEYLEKAKANGALAVAFTNVVGSKLDTIADYTVFFDAGEEKAVAATKTYMGTLAAFYMLSMAMSGREDEIEQNLEAAALAVQKVIDLEKAIEALAERYRYMDGGVVVARGVNYANALEMSLKLAETCYVKMRGFSAADFLHGPIASVAKGDPCFIFAPEGNTIGQVSEAVEKLNARGAETVVISNNSELLDIARVPVCMPDICEFLSPMVYITFSQIFANFLSVTIGNNPDQPEGLAKVTKTV